MPITNLFGPPGSGKSYELVNRFMVEAVEERRPHVYHTIEGIDPAQWEVEFGYPAELITLVDEEWFSNPLHFPVTHEDHKSGKFTMKGGEIILVDEAGLLFPAGTGKNNALPPRFEAYLRKHRHFTGRTADGKIIATDLVFASQDPDTLAKPLMTLSGQRVDYASLKEFHPRAYRATYYKSRFARKSSRQGKPKLRTMKPEGFKRYNSFAGGANAQVVLTDKSTRFWTAKKIGLLSLIPLVIFGGVPTAAYMGWGLVKERTAQMERLGGAAPVAAKVNRPDACPEGTIINVSKREYFDAGQWKQAIPVNELPVRWKLGGCSFYFGGG